MSGAGQPRGFLPGQHVIEGYGQGGFRFANMSHQGSILSVPSGMYVWLRSHEAFEEADFARVFADAERTDMFFLGCGSGPLPVSSAIRQLFREQNIAFDAMTTAAAAQTYNVLLGEKRRVACALIAV